MRRTTTPPSPSDPAGLFQASPAALAELDPAGRVRAANPALASLLGASDPDNLTDRSLSELLTEAEHAQAQESLARAAAGETARLRAHSRELGPGAPSRALDLTLAPQPETGEAPAALVLVATEAAPMPADNGEAAEYYEEMFRRNPAPKLLIEPESGLVIDANPAALAFYGYALEEIRQLHIQDINTLSAEEVQAERQRAQREERRYFTFRHRLADGEARDVKVYSGPIRIAGRDYLHSIVHDVTESRRYQQHLEQYKALFNALPVGVYRNDPGDKGHFREVNPAMLRIFGAETTEQLLATPTADLYRDPEERQRFSDDLLAQGEVHGRELALQTLDGHPLWAAITARVRETADGETLFEGALEDITGRKETEQALAHERQVAEALRRILTELVYQTPPPDTLFERVCRLAVESGGFRLAWVGRLDEQGWLRPEAWGGEATAYLEGLALTRDPEHPQGQGPGGRALREEQPVIVQDLDEAHGMGPWRQRAEEAELWGVAVLPFHEAGALGGLLVVYAPERHFFSDAIVDLLEQMGLALGYALDSHNRYRERQRAEAELRNSEQRYRSIITAMAEGVALHGPDGAIVATNPAAEHILGLSEDQIRGRTSTDPRWRAIREDGSDFPGEDHPAMVSLHSGQQVRGQIMGIQDPERGTRWISINAEPLLTDTGTAGAVATFADITERYEAEAARDRLIEILDNTPDLVGFSAPEGQILYLNRAAREFYGTAQPTPERMREVHPDWAWERVQNEGIPAALRDGSWVGETATLDANGQETPISQVILAHRDEHGELTRLSTIMRDISQQKEREASLRRLTEILEATPDFVSIAHPDGTVLYVNQGGRRLVGLPPSPSGVGDDIPADIRESETAGRWGHPEWAGQLIAQEGIPTALQRGVWEGETALLDVAGHEIPVSQVILAHRDEHGEMTRLSTIMRDISQQKALQHTLSARQEALRRLQDITGDPQRSLDNKLEGILRLGAEIFGLPYGILSHIQGEDYLVRNAVSPDASLTPGQHFDLGITYCTQTLDADGPVGFYRAGESEIRSHPCYQTQGMEAYLGVPIRLGDQVYGTLNFSRPEPREPYSDFDWELLKLMGQWISYELTREANRQALERERNLFVGGPTVVFQWQPDPARTITYVSPNVADNFGFDPDQLRGRSFAKLIRPDDRRRILEDSAERSVHSPEQSYEQEYRLLAGDGRERWIYDFTVPNFDDHGEVESYQGYLLDITARRALEAEQRLLATAFHTSQALLITDATGTIERVNPAFTAITGYDPGEVIGANPRILSSGTHGPEFYRDLWQQLKKAGHWEGEIWNRRKSGEIYPEWESITAVYNEAGQVEHYVAVFHEITEQKHLEAELERLATHDRLTGIYNRGKLYELLEGAREEYDRYGTPFSVIMFDIDHFKAINDRYGHGAGDTVLRELSERVSAALRETDHFGRWGGEEFLILAGHTEQTGGTQLAERIRHAVADTPFPQVGTITISLGVAEVQEDEALEHLEERADEALYGAKALGRNRVVPA